MRDDELLLFFFFFQAEDGIRDVAVTGVQTCALPILSRTCAFNDTRPSSISSRSGIEATTGPGDSATSQRNNCCQKRSCDRSPRASLICQRHVPPVARIAVRPCP